MFRDAGFPRPIPSFGRPVPPVLVDPGQEPTVHFKLNAAWLPVVRGALMQLVNSATWDAPNPADMELVLGRAQELLILFDDYGQPEPPCPVDICGSWDDDMGLIRQAKDFCGLETSSDGVHWCTLADFSDCIKGIVAQQIGAGPLLPGQSYNTCKTLNATDQWLLPVTVNSGDVITFSGLTGAWSATGGISGWQCPDGSDYAFGFCTPFSHTSGGDPAPAIAHGALIISIGGVFYKCAGPSITVPGGIVNAQAFVQANFAALTGSFGSVGFCVDVARAALPTGEWTHVFDWRKSASGVIFAPDGSGGVFGQWTPGYGLQSVPYASDPQGLIVCSFAHQLSYHVTKVETMYSRTTPTTPSSAFHKVVGTAGATVVWSHDMSVGPGALDDVVIVAGFIDAIGYDHRIDITDYNGIIIQQTTITGTGPEPSWPA